MRHVRRILLVVFAVIGVLVPVPVARGVEPPGLLDACPVGEICVAVDVSSPAGAARLRAQGFLNGISDQTPLALVTALKPQLWRATDHAPSGGITQYDRAKATGAVMDYVMVSDWMHLPGNFTTAWTCQPGINQPPGIRPGYVNLTEYDAFLDSFIAEKLAAGKDITYWEPENEPDITGCVYGGRYKYLRYEQFKHAYDKVTAAVPGAKVTAPSIDVFADAQAPTGCHPSVSWIDLSSMLDHAKMRGIRYGALAWHEIADAHGCNPELEVVSNPPVIIDHVARARALVAARQPEVGNPEIVINEYGTPSTWMLPGWIAGFLSALEKADVDAAARSCWPDMNGGGIETCYDPRGVVDGLFTVDGQPQANYWAHRAYADMSCPDATCAVRQTTRVDVSSSDDRVTGFATRDDALSKVSLLVGRHASCTSAVNVSCGQPASTTPAAASSTVSLGYPYGGSARVVVQRIPNVRGAVTAMTTVSDTTVAAAGGAVTATIPAFADGEAYVVTAAPA